MLGIGLPVEGWRWPDVMSLVLACWPEQLLVVMAAAWQALRQMRSVICVVRAVMRWSCPVACAAAGALPAGQAAGMGRHGRGQVLL